MKILKIALLQFLALTVFSIANANCEVKLYKRNQVKISNFELRSAQESFLCANSVDAKTISGWSFTPVPFVITPRYWVANLAQCRSQVNSNKLAYAIVYSEINTEFSADSKKPDESVRYKSFKVRFADNQAQGFEILNGAFQNSDLSRSDRLALEDKLDTLAKYPKSLPTCDQARDSELPVSKN